MSEPTVLTPPPSAPTGQKILWHSNAPWAGTGYGTQSALFAPLLAERLGYRVAFSAFFGLRGARLGWGSAAGNPYVVYPGGRDNHGNDVLGMHAKHWFGGEHGLIFMLTDPWVIHHKLAAQMPLVAWTPVDHDPLQPVTKTWFKKSGAIPLAMSRFGQMKLEDAGFEDVSYCPHAFSKDVFRQQDRAEVRKQLGFPQDAFIVGMVAANKGNPSRKNFQGAIQAFKILQRRHPEALLYLHTQLEDPDGEDLLAMCSLEKVRPRAVNQYAYAMGIPEAVVAATHAAFDVLLCPSWGEGFGVPLIEAQASGTPCIVTDFSAMPEVAPQSAGNWNIPGPMKHTHWKSLQMDPDVDELAAALTEAFEEPNEDRLERRASVAQWALTMYEVDHVVDTYMAPALERAIQELDWRALSMIVADDDE